MSGRSFDNRLPRHLTERGSGWLPSGTCICSPDARSSTWRVTRVGTSIDTMCVAGGSHLRHGGDCAAASRDFLVLVRTNLGGSTARRVPTVGQPSHGAASSHAPTTHAGARRRVVLALDLPSFGIDETNWHTKARGAGHASPTCASPLRNSSALTSGWSDARKPMSLANCSPERARRGEDKRNTKMNWRHPRRSRAPAARTLEEQLLGRSQVRARPEVERHADVLPPLSPDGARGCFQRKAKQAAVERPGPRPVHRDRVGHGRQFRTYQAYHSTDCEGASLDTPTFRHSDAPRHERCRL